MVTLPLLLMIIAIILLVLAGFGVSAGRVSLGWIGLASWALAVLLGSGLA